MRKFLLTALFGIADDGVVRGPALVGTLFAPTQGSHFQALHSFNFLFICALHWCKHCTVLVVASIVCKFPMTALCGIAAHGLICRPILVGTLFAPTQGLHFQAIHPLSFLFINTLHWCNHCTVLEVAPNVRKFPLSAVCEFAAE